MEAAGDQYVGRTITGLPVLDPRFASSPPYFKNTPNRLNQIIEQNFINLPNNLNRVAEFCLASLVYHSEFLFSVLSPNHPVLNSAIFRNVLDMTALKTDVTVTIGTMQQDSNIISIIGIPPHVSGPTFSDIRRIFLLFSP